MCRHLAYLGTRTTLASVLLEPELSLYRQSWAPRLQRHGTVNADGYGVGWYPGPGDPGASGEDDCFRHRRAVPIWADANLPDLARSVRSHAFLAAVRSATAGTTQDESAAAPFREGRWLFSHNGAVPDWTRLPTAGTGLDSADLLSLEAAATRRCCGPWWRDGCARANPRASRSRAWSDGSPRAAPAPG